MEDSAETENASANAKKMDGEPSTERANAYKKKIPAQLFLAALKGLRKNSDARPSGDKPNATVEKSSSHVQKKPATRAKSPDSPVHPAVVKPEKQIFPKCAGDAKPSSVEAGTDASHSKDNSKCKKFEMKSRSGKPNLKIKTNKSSANNPEDHTTGNGAVKKSDVSSKNRPPKEYMNCYAKECPSNVGSGSSDSGISEVSHSDLSSVVTLAGSKPDQIPPETGLNELTPNACDSQRKAAGPVFSSSLSPKRSVSFKGLSGSKEFNHSQGDGRKSGVRHDLYSNLEHKIASSSSKPRDRLQKSWNHDVPDETAVSHSRDPKEKNLAFSTESEKYGCANEKRRGPLPRSKSFVESGFRRTLGVGDVQETCCEVSNKESQNTTIAPAEPLVECLQTGANGYSDRKIFPGSSTLDSHSAFKNKNSSGSFFSLDPKKNDSGCYEVTPDKSCCSLPRLSLKSDFSSDAGSSFLLDNLNSSLEDSLDPVIPPPVPVSNAINLNEKLGSSGVVESEESSATDNETSCFQELDSKQLEGISEFLENTVDEKSVRCLPADRVLSYLNTLFKDQLEGNVIDVYGSYDSDLAISTSDINLFLKLDSPIRKGFMYEVYKVLSSERDKYNVLPYEERNSALETKIQFSDPVSGLSCELAYLGKKASSYKKMGKLLKSVCIHDKRIKILITAVKIWAEVCLINEVEEGKLHPVGYIMMVLHFLQHYEKPLLPIPIEFYPNMKIEGAPPKPDSSVGELWMEFFKYYVWTFDWTQNVVTITSEEPVSKKARGWQGVWLAIEDPYTGKNIAKTVVNADVADSIKACFKATYEYFSSPLSSFESDFPEDPQNGEKSAQLSRYSFQNCVVDMSMHYCEACDELDDVCEECQKKNYVAPMGSVPAMTDEFLEKIKEVLECVYVKYLLTEEEVREREEFVERLQDIVRRVYEDAELHMFGSSANGFGFKNSDLDICICFADQNKLRNTEAILRSLRNYLQRDGEFENVIAIFSANIPILKFHYTPKGWRGDICIKNSLAVHNSKLLHAYSLIDERCRILGCALKLLAKKALIAGVTEKALSSYSYLIMVIHFLQQTDPPVLPVLQDLELHKNELKVNDIVDGWNVWYYTGRDLQPANNTTPVEQLWLDLLDYYCEYDGKQFITIRQKEPLLMKDKQSTASLFNIQDPFIEIKNLGRVMSAQKAKETSNVFRRARYLFRNPIKEFPSHIEDLEGYFFSTMSLTGRIHKEAHCDMCGQYGHEQKDCKHNNIRNRPFTYRRFRPKPAYKNSGPLRWKQS